MSKGHTEQPFLLRRGLRSRIILNRRVMASLRDALAKSLKIVSGNPPEPFCTIFRAHDDPSVLFGLTASQIVDRLPTRTIPLFVSDASVPLDRPAFRDVVREECFERWPFLATDWRPVQGKYDIHHKRPRSMGGTNAFENLVLIDRDVHDEIHRRVDAVLSKADQIVAEHKGRYKLLLSLVKKNDEIPPSLREKLSAVHGLTFDETGKPFITIPYPEGRVLIPHFLSGYAFEFPVSNGAPTSSHPRYPDRPRRLAADSAPEIAA